MKKLSVFILLLFAQVTFYSTVNAGDYDWMRDIDVRAIADRSGIRAKIAARFNIGEAKVQAVVNNLGTSSDAYMAFRLGELANRPIDDVTTVYRTHRKKGWGFVAKRLGIKPGSSEFHALKRGHDLDHARRGERGSSSEGNSGNGMGKGKEKGNKKGNK